MATVNIGSKTGAYTFTVAGYKLYQDNASFGTSSSAFGFSEASMTVAQQVTTKSGGLVSSTLNDAFDGFASFGLVSGGHATSTTYVDPDGIVDITGNTITGDFTTVGSDGNSFGGLSLSQQNSIIALDAHTPIIRSILAIKNPTNAPITQVLGEFSNLGSDSNTTIYATSSGNSFSVADRWVVTFQNYSGNTSSDPRILHVMEGPGKGVKSQYATSWTGTGSDRTNWFYPVTVAPGQTKYIMVFAGLFGQKAQARAVGENVFDSNATVISAGLVSDLSATQLADTINWDFTSGPQPAPPLILIPESSSFLLVLLGIFSILVVARRKLMAAIAAHRFPGF